MSDQGLILRIRFLVWSGRKLEAGIRAEEESYALMVDIIDGSHLTQAEISKRTHVSQPYVAQLRKGRHPTLLTLFRLALACGMQLRISAAALGRTHPRKTKRPPGFPDGRSCLNLVPD